MGCVLIAASIIDLLHWEILGYLQKPKLTLTTLVDPEKSRVAHALSQVLNLMASWNLDQHQWQVLRFLGLDTLDIEEVMMFARANLVGTSAGIFFYLERRFACFPYLLQHLFCPPELRPSTRLGSERV